MEEATKELGAGGQGELIAQWLMASFKPVPRVDAMRIDLFRTLLCDKFKMSVLALKPILTGMGIKADGEAAWRSGVPWQFPTLRSWLAQRLRSLTACSLVRWARPVRMQLLGLRGLSC